MCLWCWVGLTPAISRGARVLVHDDFNTGTHGWVELLGNYDGQSNLDTVDDHMRDFRPPDGFGLHYYTDLRPTKVKSADFQVPEWYEVLLRGVRLEKVIEDHWSEMGKFDPAHRTKLIVDEWGVWYPPGEEITPAYILSQPITLRDAVHTGMHLDIFNRNAGKLARVRKRRAGLS